MCRQLNQARILLCSKLLFKNKIIIPLMPTCAARLRLVPNQKKYIEPININLSDFRILFGLIFQILLTSHLSTSPIEIVVGYQTTTTTYILCRFVCKRVQYRLSLLHSLPFSCLRDAIIHYLAPSRGVHHTLIITRESPRYMEC